MTKHLRLKSRATIAQLTRNLPLCERQLEPVILVAQLLLDGLRRRGVNDRGRAARSQRTARRATHRRVPTFHSKQGLVSLCVAQLLRNFSKWVKID